MVCRYCQRTISITHRLVDKEFCCKQHRNAFSARSARALREMGEFTYSVADVLRDTDEFAIPKKKVPANGSRSTATVLGLAALTIAGLVVMEKAGFGASQNTKTERAEARQGTVGRLVGMVIDRMPKSAAGGLVIEDRFQAGLRNWLPAPGTGMSGWRMENGLIRPGGLRIWDESRNLADYSFQFEGKVENNALGWVVRAPNHNNYYAAKLSIPERGGNTRPEIVRFSVIQGQESRRQHFPIPIQIAKGEFYDYEVRAVGDRILTMVGGRVVDQWRDARFRTGGVGFFSERGDKSSIRWAKLQEGESIADKLRSYLTFGLIVPMM
ncbi:MAG: hypothetical protein HYX27_05900 [Acidobacteria bacterium]|nr:hypothetical protein [Acidobacteriota bacterium]